jgi:hypothetical protein
MTLRSWLYGVARMMGNISAVQKGTVPKRVARIGAGRVASRMLGKLFR